MDGAMLLSEVDIMTGTNHLLHEKQKKITPYILSSAATAANSTTSKNKDYPIIAII